MSTSPCCLVLADDSALLREGLCGLLERQGFQIVAQEARADDLRQTMTRFAVSGCLPEVLITDVRMPPNMTDDGLLVAVELKSAYPELGVLVLSQYVSPIHAQQLFALPSPPQAGGAGYLLKDRVAQVADFIGSLRVVAAGGVVIDPDGPSHDAIKPFRPGRTDPHRRSEERRVGKECRSRWSPYH